MTKLLYVSHRLVEQCGVREFGRQHAAAIDGSAMYDLVFCEVNSAVEYFEYADLVQPDVTFFNYMPQLMPWLADRDGKRELGGGKRVVVQHLYSEATVSSIMDGYGGLFDAMVCLDPSLNTGDPRVFAQHRPIPRTVPHGELSDRTSIGSFGFGMPHKNFPLIAREINRCFDDAVFNLHMTVGGFAGDYSAGILAECQAEITKPGIELVHTSQYLNKNEVIHALSRNHINALFYELNQESPGISSSLDFLVAARRPVLLSDCALFRHVQYQGSRFPETDFAWIMEHYIEMTAQAELTYTFQSGWLRADTEKMLRVLLP